MNKLYKILPFILFLYCFPILAQKKCTKFSLHDFVGYDQFGTGNSCRWIFEDFIMALPSRDGSGQICATGKIGQPFPFGLGNSPLSYYKITCNIPAGKVIKINGACCQTIELNNALLSNCNSFIVSTPITTIALGRLIQCNSYESVNFEICDPYLRHSYVDLLTNKESELSTVFFNDQASNSIVFKTSTDGTKSSKFTLNVDGLTLKIKETGSVALLGKLEAGSENGTYYYTHPTYLPPNGNQSITLQVLDASMAIVKEVPLKLYSPPVMMVHGLWGNRNKFITLNYNLLTNGYEIFQTNTAGYEETNSAKFAASVNTIKNSVADAIGNMVQQKIATGKIDVLAHSMGGIIARLYLQQTGDKNQINKFITINTPHGGSQIANVLHDPNFGPANTKMCEIQGGCYDGAVANLRVNSPEISILNTVSEPTVSSHAIISYIDGSDLSNMGVAMNFITKIVGITPIILSAIFNNQQHDGMVTINSQAGGLASGFTSKYANINHTDAPNNPQIMSRIVELLKSDPASPVFSHTGFHPIQEIYTSPQNVSANTIDGRINIVTPITPVVNRGGNVTYQINATPPANSTSTIHHITVKIDNNTANNTGIINGNSGQVSIALNGNTLGDNDVYITAEDATGKVLAFQKSKIFVNTTETPQKVIVNPYFVSKMNLGETKKFRIDGIFSGWMSEITPLSGITYSFNNNKAVYNGENVIKAVDTGQVQMTVSFKGIKSAFVPITIVSASTTPISDIFSDDSQTIKIKSYPSPAKDILNIEIDSPEKTTMNINILDMLNKSIITQSLNLENGKNSGVIDVSKLTSGLYLLNISNNKTQKNLKFIKI